MKKTLFLLLTAALLFGAVVPSQAKKAPKTKTPTQQIRLMDYNIADGMWYDQYNHYDRFVDWVNSQKPDIFALCEAATHWDKNKKSTPRDTVPRYLPDSLQQLAARWGHAYVAVGPYQDNYPVAITSRFPIEVVQRIGGDNMSHGALHVRINGINYIVLHLWPQRYSKNDTTRSDNGGEEFRVSEIMNVLNKTILNPLYKKEKHWVMMGDFNSRSPLDSAAYKGANYDVHRAIRDAYPHDVIGELNPCKFVPSDNKDRVRIDFIYCTDAIMSGVIHAEIHKDDFTKVASDHRPVIMDFKAPLK